MSDEEFSFSLSSDRSAPRTGDPGVDADLLGDEQRPARRPEVGRVEFVEERVGDGDDVDVPRVDFALLGQRDQHQIGRAHV